MVQIAVRVKSSFHEVEINTTSAAFRAANSEQPSLDVFR